MSRHVPQEGHPLVEVKKASKRIEQAEPAAKATGAVDLMKALRANVERAQPEGHQPKDDGAGPEKERTMDGLEAARARGRTGGQKPKFGPRQVRLAWDMYDSCDYTVQQIADEFGVTRPTVYRHLSKVPRQR
ncbi:helix-turn-helix domain-containing protein [Streptomyces sp. NBC_00190]|uniref:helix-turn-helix domain-containing protein n=1 Tax=unclassified Streptomyces TaxID=2593676 RepID=UPI002E2BE54C|nr:helix-turn-helix domain-containing protein [Streptomyces sp. NBC_00190]WSZ44670.1 helix-turn-helix domain-containing protein [Streptomyces sp. NBC_00868]